MRLQLIFMLLVVSIISCDNQPVKQQDERPFRLSENGDTVFQYLSGSGVLISEETVKKGEKNGPAWTYYPSGKVKEKVLYKDDKKNGMAIWYFENGSIYQQTPYLDGLINGVRKKYHDNGMLAAEIPYQEGQPFLGTMEYDRNGMPLLDTTRLLFYPENDVEKEGKFRLRLYLSDKSRDVFYYYYKEVDGEPVKVGIPAAHNGIGDYILTGIPNTAVPQKIRFYAEKNTANGNPLVVSDVYDFEKAIREGEGKDYPKGGPRRIY